MDSAMIGKIEKAMRYACEPERVQFTDLELVFKGDHDSYTVTYHHGKWTCGCGFFQKRKVCSHTMTLERILRGMLPADAEAEAAAV